MLLNKNKSLILAAMLSGFPLSQNVLAEDVPTIVVSASRTYQSTVTIPTNIKVITHEEIIASGATNFADVISGVGGLHVTDLYGDGTAATVSMRGFNNGAAASNTLVIVDGRRLNNIDLSGPDLSAISIKNIEQIEIIQGSAGVLYGDQAVGGVINVITRKPQAFSADLEVRAGSYGRNQIIARATDKLSTKVSYVFSGDVLTTDNYRDNNALDDANFLGKLDYEFSSGNAYAEFQFITKDQELPGVLTEAEVDENRRQSTANFLNDYVDETTKVGRLGSNILFNDAWTFETELAYRDFNSESVTSFTSFVNTQPFIIDSNQIEFTPRLIGVVPLNGGEAVFTTGIDYLKSDYESLFFSTLTDTQEILSYYLQAVVPIVSSTSITLGGRKGSVESDIVSEFTTGELRDRVSAFEFGIQSKLTENLTLFARYDQNFRFAKVDELSLSSPTAPLRTQTGESNEVGVEWRENSYAIKAQAYRLELEDEIAFDPTADAPPTSPFQGANVNLDSTVHDGVIVELDYQVNRALDLATMLSFTDTTFATGPLEGNKVSGVPERKVSVVVNYSLKESMKTQLEMLYTDDQYMSGDNANNGPQLDSYTVINANFRYTLKQWTFSARVNNLMNEKHSSSATNFFGNVFLYPSPERSYLLSASVSF